MPSTQTANDCTTYETYLEMMTSTNRYNQVLSREQWNAARQQSLDIDKAYSEWVPVPAIPRTISLQHSRAMFNAVTEFDQRASTRKGHNPYALGHYAKGLSMIRQYVEIGATLRQAIVITFCDRIRDCVLKSVGESNYVRWEESSFPRFTLPDESDDE